jgi:D-erythronate 2-dehydrogenase
MRAVALPGLTVSVDQMVAALERVGGPKAVRLLDFEPDDTVTAIVAGWPGNWDDERGRALGLIGDDNIDAIVLAFSQTL